MVINLSEREYHAMDKKIWVAPAVEVLPIDATLSGSKKKKMENFIYYPKSGKYGSFDDHDD